MNISASVYKRCRKQIELVKALFAGGTDFAFEVLNASRLGAEVLETHSAAHKIEMGYLGFQVEGRRRKAVYKAGVYYDSVQIGLLREEWENTERVIALKGDNLCCNDNFDHAKAQRCINRFNSNYSNVLSSESNGCLN
jgi:hypothetical protein